MKILRKDIDSKYLYPKIAKPCKLANISDSWKNNKVSLQKFQKYIKEEKIEKAIIISDQSSTNLNIVQITLEKGDLMAKMVNKGLAHYNHENRESNASQIGSTSLVYVMNGFSDFANVRVTTTKITKGYTTHAPIYLMILLLLKMPSVTQNLFLMNDNQTF